MLMFQWPLMLCALLPVILVETEVVRRQLSLPYRNAIVGAAKANVLSTAAGVPLAWVIMLVVEFAAGFPLLSAAEKRHWPVEHSPVEYILDVLTMAWIGPSVPGMALAAALLLIPTFFISLLLERRSYRRSWPDVNRAAVDRSVWFANLASYSLLFLAACVWYGWAVRTHPV
jgi:hypothetical protein